MLLSTPASVVFVKEMCFLLDSRLGDYFIPSCKHTVQQLVNFFPQSYPLQGCRKYNLLWSPSVCAEHALTWLTTKNIVEAVVAASTFQSLRLFDTRRRTMMSMTVFHPPCRPGLGTKSTFTLQQNSESQKRCKSISNDCCCSFFQTACCVFAWHGVRHLTLSTALPDRIVLLLCNIIWTIHRHEYAVQMIENKH